MPLINASKKSDREARSTTGVPVMPVRIKIFRTGWSWRTGVPISVRCQITEPRCRVKRINIVRFGHRNDHRPIRTALDVKRLRMNGADDRAIKVQIADQIGRVARRESGIDVKTVARRIVVLLRDVDLRIACKAAVQPNSE